jgi:hypothetical protein
MDWNKIMNFLKKQKPGHKYVEKHIVMQKHTDFDW